MSGYGREFFDRVYHPGKPSFICVKKEGRTLWLCTVHSKLHKITIKISAIYLAQMIHGVNCQNRSLFQEWFKARISHLNHATTIYLLRD